MGNSGVFKIILYIAAIVTIVVGAMTVYRGVDLVMNSNDRMGGAMNILIGIVEVAMGLLGFIGVFNGVVLYILVFGVVAVIMGLMQIGGVIAAMDGGDKREWTIANMVFGIVVLIIGCIGIYYSQTAR